MDKKKEAKKEKERDKYLSQIRAISKKNADYYFFVEIELGHSWDNEQGKTNKNGKIQKNPTGISTCWVCM